MHYRKNEVILQVPSHLRAVCVYIVVYMLVVKYIVVYIVVIYDLAGFFPPADCMRIYNSIYISILVAQALAY